MTKILMIVTVLVFYNDTCLNTAKKDAMTHGSSLCVCFCSGGMDFIDA